MCGIAGILNLDGEPVSPVVLRGMSDALRHRGPNGEGHYSDGPLGFAPPAAGGARPEPGGQPADAHAPTGATCSTTTARSTTSRSCAGSSRRSASRSARAATPRWCSTPSRPGARSPSSASTACSPWPSGTARSGDSRWRATASGSSRSTGRGWARRSCSPPRSRACSPHPAWRTELDFEALAEYLTFQNLFTDRTLFRGAQLLPAGSVVRVDARDGVGTPRRYWDFDFREPDEAGDPAEYLEELRPAVPPGGQPPARGDVPVGLLPERGHGLGLDHRARPRSSSRS